MKFKSCYILILLILLSSSRHSAWAEIIHFVDGKSLEGKILSESIEDISLRTNSGMEITISQDRIQSIDRVLSPEDVHANTILTLDESDAPAEDYYQLGNWSLDHFNVKTARLDWQRAIAKDSDHLAARQALGYSRYKGQWFIKDELAAYRIQEKEEEAFRILREQQLAIGLDWFEKEWVPVEDLPKLQQGFRQYAGIWFSQEDYLPVRQKFTVEVMQREKKLQTYMEDILYGHATERFSVQSTVSGRFSKSMIEMLNDEYEHAVQVLGLEAAGCLWEGRVRFYAFQEKSEAKKCYSKLLKSKEHSKWFVSLMKDKPYGRMESDLFSLDYLRGDKTRLLHSATHNLGHFIMRYLHPEGKPPAWLQEGFAAYLEDHSLGELKTFCVTADATVEGKNKNKHVKKNIYRHVQSLVKSKKDVPVKQMLLRTMSNFNSNEVYKAAAFMAFLIEKDQVLFTVYLRDALEAAPLQQSKTLQAHWNLSADEMDIEFRSWILALDFSSGTSKKK